MGNSYLDSLPPSKELAGGFYQPLRGAPQGDLPFRPPEQEPARIPPSLYVDRIENGRAVLLDHQGRAQEVPAAEHWREGHMTDGSYPDDGGEAASIRGRLSAGDDRHSMIDLGAPLPKIPLAPGSPGPPIPPAADSMIGVKKGSSQQKRRPIP